ncbi:hypothetical protein [Rhodococcus koreensis]|uniref:hypothetical protein n=1 Tax=Rhodococcus koreensis TaxID=99653 RepID=UPI0036DCE690
MTETSAEPAHTVDGLFDEYDQWKSVLDRDSDEFGALAKLTALYRFAISNYNEPGKELLLRALAAVESTPESDR